MTCQSLFRHQGFRFLFYSNESKPREPVHIHAVKDGIDARFWIHPVRLTYNDGFDAKALRGLVEVIESHAEDIERAWNEHFG